jgi:hypothetical protein
MSMQKKRGSAVIFLYHRISPTIDPAYQPLHPEIFLEHCDFIKKRPFKPEVPAMGINEKKAVTI